MTVTREQIVAHLQATKTVAELIRELGSVPNGVLYAHIMGHMSFDTYTSLIGMLKHSGLVTESHNLLIWVGVPEREASDESA